MAKIFVKESERITTFALEGTAVDIEKGLANYREKFKPNSLVEINPVTSISENERILDVYLYFPEVCYLGIYQRTEGKSNLTRIMSHGTGKQEALDFFKSFAGSFMTSVNAPSDEFKARVSEHFDYWNSILSNFPMDNRSDMKLALFDAMRYVAAEKNREKAG
jgi:hypothetical protein